MNMKVTTNLMEYSIFTAFAIKYIWHFVVFGILSYNIPEIFKQNHNQSYILRAGINTVMSVMMLLLLFVLPNQYFIMDKLLIWGMLFVVGIILSIYGGRILEAKFGNLMHKLTVKNSVRKGSKTDIRNMERELPTIANYNPMKYINIKRGIFVGLDESIQPIYLKVEDWVKRHFLIVGATRSGKGVAMQSLGIQSLMLGETLVVLDPKGDKFMPSIFKQQCDKQNLNYTYIDLTKDTAQINLIGDIRARDLKNCLVESFSQREMGSESDVYRKNEQEFLENLANFIVSENQEATNNNNGNIQKQSLAELCKKYDINRYSDNYKSSVSDLNKLANVTAINANSNTLQELIDKGGCIYIVGDLLDETMKKIQRFIFCRIVQIARNHSNNNNEQEITVFADELVAHISRFVAESYTVSLGWGLKIISAIQDLKLLRGAPADLDPEFLKGAVFGNSQNKLFYRADDIQTADFLSDMTGKIIVEEEQKLVTRNNLHAERLDRQTRLVQSERNYFDRNMILNLKQFEAVFCASLPYRKTIASLCKTIPVTAVNDNDAKETIRDVKESILIYNQTTNEINTNFTHRNEEYHDNNQQYREQPNNEQSNSSYTDNNSNNDASRREEKTSTSKPDYLF